MHPIFASAFRVANLPMGGRYSRLRSNPTEPMLTRERMESSERPGIIHSRNTNRLANDRRNIERPSLRSAAATYTLCLAEVLAA